MIGHGNANQVSDGAQGLALAHQAPDLGRDGGEPIGDPEDHHQEQSQDHARLQPHQAHLLDHQEHRAMQREVEGLPRASDGAAVPGVQAALQPGVPSVPEAGAHGGGEGWGGTNTATPRTTERAISS